MLKPKEVDFADARGASAEGLGVEGLGVGDARPRGCQEDEKPRCLSVSLTCRGGNLHNRTEGAERAEVAGGAKGAEGAEGAKQWIIKPAEPLPPFNQKYPTTQNLKTP